MSFFDFFPYTNFHNVNLDWVLQRVKEWGEMVEANNIAFHNLEEANASFKRYVETYLQNLDVQEEINIKLDNMLENGELTTYMRPYISNATSDWLSENITEPEGVVIDASLTVAGACADAKAVGDRLEKLDEITEVDPNSGSAIDNSQFVNMSGYIIDTSTHKINTYANYALMYVPCLPDTIYKVSKTVSNRFVVGYTTETPSRGTDVLGYVSNSNADSIIIETGKNASYLVVYYKSASDTLTEQEIFDSISIVENVRITAVDLVARRYLINSIKVSTEHGNFNLDTGKSVREYGWINRRFKTAFPVKVEPNATISIEIYKDNNTADLLPSMLLEYAEDYTFIRTSTISDNVFTVGDNTKYIYVLVRYSTDNHNPEFVTFTSDTKMEMIKRFPINGAYEEFVYEVYPSVFTVGVLMLPPNYDINGNAVPLMAFGHGSYGFASWNASMGALYGESFSYLPYMEYLRDEGYAVFDCFGCSKKYISSSTQIDTESNFASHIVMQCYMSGIEYILKHYNLDADNVNFYGKSLGGFICAVMANQTRIKVKTVSMLCPWINQMSANNTGWTRTKRVMLAEDWELEGDVSTVFTIDNFNMRSETGQAFIRQNLPHIVCINPAWQYYGRTANEKFTDTVEMHYNKTEYSRRLTCPVKIWGSADDAQIPLSQLTEYISQSQNGGNDAILRLMPNGTGGHHSVDSDPNALKSSGITALGIPYTNIPTAYVEMVQFVRSRA